METNLPEELASWPQEWRDEFAAQNAQFEKDGEELLTAAEFLECRADDCAELEDIRRRQLASYRDVDSPSGWRIPTLDEALVLMADMDVKNGSTLLRLAAVLAKGVVEHRERLRELGEVRA
jgi:hypothetical protein